MATGQSVYSIICHLPVDYNIIGDAQKIFKDARMFIEIRYYKSTLKTSYK